MTLQTLEHGYTMIVTEFNVDWKAEFVLAHRMYRLTVASTGDNS